MTIGASILLGVIGAILYFAVSDGVDGVNIGLIGVILMIAGAVGLVIGLVLEMNGRRGTVVSERVVEERRPPV